MKKITMVTFVILILPIICFAETYQNPDHNFQIDIPDGWTDVPDKTGKYLINKKIIRNQGTENQEWAGIVFVANIDTVSTDTATTASLTAIQRRDFLNGMEKNIVEKYPTAQLTYSDVITLGNNDFLVTKYKIGLSNQQIRLVFISALSHRTQYFSVFLTGDKGQYEQQFFDMLKTLRPIVGNNDTGEWREDIKYKRDIAEQDAISALTSQPITITK